jgi:hypothetical protein
MGYYVRVFCTAERPPTIRTALGALQSKGLDVRAGEDCNTAEKLDASNWSEFTLMYKPEKLGIIVECNQPNGSDTCLFAEELAEFQEVIGPPGRSKNKRKVLEHLAQTKFIIACQLPTHDIDDDGYDANGAFLTYFVENFGGMIQADGEGFYEGTKIIVSDES